MDLIWDGEHLLVAGPDTEPKWSDPTGPFAVGVRFRPGAGPLVLGVPANALRDQRIALEMLWPDLRQVVDELLVCGDLRECSEVLERSVARRLPAVGAPDPLVEAAARIWASGDQSISTAKLSESAGLSPRQLHRRFVIAVGYGPKLLQRVLRFQTFLASCADMGLGLAEVAVRCGYADQAHLSREARTLADLTPDQLRTTRLMSETFKTVGGSTD
jgi:AraC-like DNA-binding protein